MEFSIHVAEGLPVIVNQSVLGSILKIWAESRWAEAFPEGELSLVLLGDSEHCDLHERFLNDPEVTDVITFQGSPEDGLAGEIVINFDQALREAALRGCETADELLLYLAHGWLHLAGLDDRSDVDREGMRHAERELLGLPEKSPAGILFHCRKD